MHSTYQLSLAAICSLLLSTAIVPTIAQEVYPQKLGAGEKNTTKNRNWTPQDLTMGFNVLTSANSTASKVSLVKLSKTINNNFTKKNHSQIKPSILTQAQPVKANNNRWYGGLGLGFNSPNLSNSVPINIPLINLAATVKTNFTGDSNLGYNGFIGYKLPNGWRTEGEIFYTNNRIDGVSTSVNGTGVSTPTVVLGSNDSTSHLAIMLNGYYDFNTNSKITPFVGAGIGYGSTTISSTATTTISGAAVPLVTNNSSSTVGLAYQFKAGVDYALTDRNDIYLQYRYLDTIGTPSYNTNSLEVGTKLSF